MLQGKHIVLGISGGIAAYKAPLLVRLLIKAGAQVKCCCTSNALQFITPLTLQTLSNNPIYTDVFAPHNEHQTEHISLPDWADLMIVAPATANIIGKFAAGIADDALSTTFLAMQKPVIIAPAMNDKMYSHPALQRNLQTLTTYPNVEVLPCADGFLACGTNGKGRMLEPEQILYYAQAALTPKTLLNKKVLITAGPTQEKIDPVRYISNFSTGKMGYALAREAQNRGAEVTLISGPTNLTFSPTNSKSNIINVLSADQMYQAVMDNATKADIIILCAAVADFTVASVGSSKIKRGNSDLCLQLSPTQDIAAAVGEIRKNNQIVVGFALETDNEEANAIGKLERKKLDYIVLNSLRDEGAGFGVDTNKVTIYSKQGGKNMLPIESKQKVASDIFEIINNSNKAY